MKQSNPGSRQNRAGRMLAALPVAAKLCSTCAFWGGARGISRRGFIEIHPYSKGGCQGEGFKHIEMPALASCGGWEPWPVFDSEIGYQQSQRFG